MIGIALEFRGDEYRELSRLERSVPKTFRAAHGIAANRAANVLRNVMQRGGNEKYGVPAFAARQWLTLAIRGAKSRAGGVLAERRRIVRFRRGAGQVIGWPDRLAAWASCYQDAVRRPAPVGERRGLYVRYGRRLGGAKVPTWYEKPARPVIDPFTDYLKDAFPGYVRAAFEKKVTALLKRGKAVA